MGTERTVVTRHHDLTGDLPARLSLDPADDVASVGEGLARLACIEAAAVTAFTDLAAQLEAHGAPAELVSRVRLAAADEVRHAREVGALARAHGAEPPPVRVEPRGLRTLLALALENAREGCVRKTWGAACAMAQSKRASDPEVRALMAGIAGDGVRHAVLSSDIASWLEARLTGDERARVLDERASAIRELEAELEAALPAAGQSRLGLPTREETRRIVASLRAQLWGPPVSRPRPCPGT